MKAIVDDDLCTGCGLCADSCADVFEMKEDKAIVKANPIPGDAIDCSKEAASNCPVEAIKVEE
ncbi:MAG: ferredoxin [Candidatus Omnitrophica bacterium]|nr:ferredoxin [Candidatus Omnitrophota bacterium]